MTRTKAFYNRLCRKRPTAIVRAAPHGALVKACHEPASWSGPSAGVLASPVCTSLAAGSVALPNLYTHTLSSIRECTTPQHQWPRERSGIVCVCVCVRERERMRERIQQHNAPSKSTLIPRAGRMQGGDTRVDEGAYREQTWGQTRGQAGAGLRLNGLREGETTRSSLGF